MALLPAFPYFNCLHHENDSVGSLGRGTHYSVLRSAEWFDIARSPLARARWHDFAIVWDEDHDERILGVVEQMHFAGLLAPVLFVGERKGSLTVLVASEFTSKITKGDFDRYKREVDEIASDIDGDSWPVRLGFADFSYATGPRYSPDAEVIIQDDERRVRTYLENINVLWTLGAKPYVPPASAVKAELG